MNNDRMHPETALSPVVFSQRPSLPPPDLEPRKRPMDPLGSIRRHRGLFWWTTLLVLLLSGAVVILRTSGRYQAKSYVYVSPTFPSTLSEEKEQDRPYDSYIADQAQTATRYDILATALSKLAPGTWQRPNESVASAVSRLQKALEVQRVGQTFQLTISLAGEDPQKTAATVNAVTDAFVAKSHSEEFYGRDQRLVNLRDERTKLQHDLDMKLADQSRLMQQLGVAQVSTGDSVSNSYDDNVKHLGELLATARE